MPRWLPRWSELGPSLAAVERWLLPGECLLCKGPAGAADPLICALCAARWPALSEPQCVRCGQPLTPAIACRICTEWPEGLAGVRSAVWLDDSVRRAVHLLKYSGWHRVAEPLAQCMAQRLGIPPGVTLVPIPLSAARLRSRGYNQSAALAGCLSRGLGVPVAEALLRRRDTRTQTQLTPEARRANLAGAFQPAGAVPRRPLVVDDVFTTGATLAEAAAALLAAGAEQVAGITFARAARPLDAAAAWSPA